MVSLSLLQEEIGGRKGWVYISFLFSSVLSRVKRGPRACLTNSKRAVITAADEGLDA
jgi:hypothetical protein